MCQPCCAIGVNGTANVWGGANMISEADNNIATDLVYSMLEILDGQPHHIAEHAVRKLSYCLDMYAVIKTRARPAKNGKRVIAHEN